MEEERQKEKENKRVYIAGPMTGHPDWNYPAFHEAAKELREMGYQVSSPAEMHSEHPKESLDALQKDRERCMREAIGMLIRCDYIVLLSGWEGSRGAILEKRIADEIGIKTLHLKRE